MTPGIFCPRCGGDTDVTETRAAPRCIRRRRRCHDLRCDGRLTTYEEVVRTEEARRRHAGVSEVRVPRDWLEKLVSLISPEPRNIEEHEYLW